MFIHLTLLPYISSSAELKTKPTQHSVAKLREIGIQPDLLLCRTQVPLTDEARDKISLFCNVRKEDVVQAIEVRNVYEVPLRFDEEGLTRNIIDKLNLSVSRGDLSGWRRWVEEVNNCKKEVDIAVVGKYVKMKDTYKSINEAFVHAGAANRLRVKLVWLEAEEVGESPGRHLSSVRGILVPGGFGSRGLAGMIEAIQYARENRIPFLGICLGMHCATVEFARNVAKLEGADTTEFNSKTPYPVIDLLPEQRKIKNKGGTMRLGTYPCRLEKNSLSYQAYGKSVVYERHRHRYEFNNEYRQILAEKGLKATGIFPERNLVEIIEASDHPWFVAVQFHPEFLSRPGSPHPLFRDFVKAAMK